MKTSTLLLTLLSILIITHCAIVNEDPSDASGGSITGATTIPNNIATKRASSSVVALMYPSDNRYPTEVFLYNTLDPQTVVQRTEVNTEGSFAFTNLDFGTYDIMTNRQETGFIYRNIILTPDRADVHLDSIPLKTVRELSIIIDSEKTQSVYFYNQFLTGHSTNTYTYRYIDYGDTPDNATTQELTLIRKNIDGDTIAVQYSINDLLDSIRINDPIIDTLIIDTIIDPLPTDSLINQIAVDTIIDTIIPYPPIDTLGDTTHTNVIYTWIVDRDGGGVDTNYVYSDSLVRTPDWLSTPMKIVSRNPSTLHRSENETELIFINYTQQALYPYARDFFSQQIMPTSITRDLNKIVVDSKGALSTIIRAKISILKKPNWATVSIEQTTADQCIDNPIVKLSTSKCIDSTSFQADTVIEPFITCKRSLPTDYNFYPIYNNYDSKMHITWDTYDADMQNEWIFVQENAYGNKDTLTLTTTLKPDTCDGGTLEITNDTLYSWIVHYGSNPPDTQSIRASTLQSPPNFDTIPISIDYFYSNYPTLTPDSARIHYTYSDTAYNFDTIKVNYGTDPYTSIDFEYLAFDTALFKSDLSTIPLNSGGDITFVYNGLDSILETPDWATLVTHQNKTACGNQDVFNINFKGNTCSTVDPVNTSIPTLIICPVFSHLGTYYQERNSRAEYTFNTCDVAADNKWKIITKNAYGYRDTIEILTTLKGTE
ncbi:MAG: hypothetical protein OCC49_18395 [Fibrobacterales bacterium]